MGLHINKVKGDFIFYAWKDGEAERLKETQEELAKLGYVLKSESDDYLNFYEHYENQDGDKKTVTMCCL
jgi:hypothetical protein